MCGIQAIKRVLAARGFLKINMAWRQNAAMNWWQLPVHCVTAYSRGGSRGFMGLLISFLVTMFYFVKKKNSLVKSFHFLAFLILLQRRISQYNLEKLAWKGCVNTIALTGVTKLVFMSIIKDINFQRELSSISKLHDKTYGLYFIC